MANAATLVLVNGVAANVNYQPTKVVTGDEAIYTDFTQAVIAAQSVASIRQKNNGSTRRVTCKVVLPVWDAVGLKVAYVLISESYLLRPLQSTNAEATDLRRRAMSLIGSSVVQSMFDTGESVW